MAKAKASSSTKSGRKKPAQKGAAAKSKAKPVEKKTQPPKDAKKTSAASANKASTRSAPSGASTKAAPQARVDDKGVSSKPSKAGAAPLKEAAKTEGASAPEPKAPTPKPVVEEAPAATARVAEIGKTPPSEAAPQASAPAKEEPKLEYEPIGPNTLDGFQLPAVYGKAGVFGGPKDRSAKPDDKLALPTGLHFQYERYRSLNPKSFYCAMRWDYRQEHKSTEEGKRWWANKKLLVANPVNGKSVVVRAVDYGPHESTGLTVAISPGAAEALGINSGDEVLVAFADPKAPTGAVA